MRTTAAKVGTRPDFFSTQVSQAHRFYLDLNPPAKSRLTVVCGGLEYCSADYAISRRTFSFFSVEFVAEGSGVLTLNGQEHALQPGNVFSYGPGVAHQIRTDNERVLVKYFIDFSGTAAKKLMTESGLKPGTLASVFPPGEIRPLFDELIHNGRRGTAGTPAICQHLLEGLLLKIQDARAPLPGRDAPTYGTYQRCREHIQQNFLRLRSVEQVAKECHLDDAYLCRLFQRYDQQSPYRFLTRLKMNHAAEQLQKPGALVKQVAEEAGFANQFHFSRVFKSVFGLSPRAMMEMR